MASFSSGMPSTLVYLVLPSRIALIAASLMLSGVSKSGSPAAREITFRPAAFRSRAFASAARVADGLTRRRAADSANMGISLLLEWKTAAVYAREAHGAMQRDPEGDTRLQHLRRNCGIGPL